MSQHSSRGKEWEALRQRVLERDGHRCVVCGGPATTVDHIVAKVNGGTDEERNLQAMCRTHNASKGTKTQERTNYYNESLFPNGLPSRR